MFYLLTSCGSFYTGRAGAGWIGHAADAFSFSSHEEASRKAALFNSRTSLHGLVFEVRAAQ